MKRPGAQSQWEAVTSLNVPFQFREGRGNVLFVLLINMMRSRVPNHIQAVPESASERDVRIQTAANPAGSVVPETLTSTLPGWGREGGRADGQSSRLAGSRLPALCAPGRLPIPFVTSACGKEWPGCQLPALEGAPPALCPPLPEVSAGLATVGSRGLGNQLPHTLQGKDCLAHHLLGPLTEPARHRRRCHPHWMVLPPARGQVPRPPGPAPHGCAGPGCGGAGLHTAGPCPWSWPGGQREELGDKALGGGCLLVGRRRPLL